ncbi:MAG: protein-L-isoaspartate O-methyltransferase [Proteobacteria bacterium]|nr:protein-L-isoaspartate O-methyltransferase [Pseudomonadota bacterium]
MIGLEAEADVEHSSSETASEDTALARFILDLRSKGITDPALLNAFESVPRGAFIGGFRPGLLYSPISLPIACGEEATDPFTLARHLLHLELRPGLRVLEIGTGSGYLSAVMARLGVEVTSYERYRSLIRHAEQALRGAGITQVAPLLGDGLARPDLPQGFDRIIVNGALEAVPGHLTDRLNVNGIALAHRRRGLETRLTLWRKDLTGYAASEDRGPSRMGLMRAGLPAIL